MGQGASMFKSISPCHLGGKYGKRKKGKNEEERGKKEKMGKRVK
jgi:hypothetical protein